MRKLYDVKKSLSNRNVAVAFGILFVFAGFIDVATAQSWTNSTNPLDVNADGNVAVDDAHIVNSELLLPMVTSSSQLPSVSNAPPFFDVNGDNFVSPIDLLLIINQGVPAGVPSGATATSGPVVVEMDFQDLAGNAINQITVGSPFQLVVDARDARTQPLGLSTAFTDVTFDTSLASVQSATPNSAFQLTAPGTISLTGIDQLGGSSALGGVGFTMASNNLSIVQMQATNLGTLTASGANGFALLAGLNDWIAPTFETATLSIVPEPSGALLLASGLVLLALRRKRS